MTLHEITIAGLGGQGSIMLGLILGTAAVKHNDLYAVQTQAYSSELRGGFAATWLIVSDKPIIYPRVTNPDYLIAQAQDSINRFSHLLKPTGTLIYDSDMTNDIPSNLSRVLGLPASSIARNRLNAPIVANMVLLGFFCNLSGLVTEQSIRSSIAEVIPKAKRKANLYGFELGLSLPSPKPNQI